MGPMRQTRTPAADAEKMSSDIDPNRCIDAQSGRAPLNCGLMKNASEYLKYAAECREMARTAPAAHRAQLERMARTWEQLAEARKRRARHTEVSEDDE